MYILILAHHPKDCKYTTIIVKYVRLNVTLILY